MDNAVQQNAMVANPNQVWFPHVVNVRHPHEVDAAKYSAPKFKTPGAVLADVITNEEPTTGEMLYFNSVQRHVTVVEILEQRPAAGDWSGAFWKGIHPTWYRCLAEACDPPAKKDGE